MMRFLSNTGAKPARLKTGCTDGSGSSTKRARSGVKLDAWSNQSEHSDGSLLVQAASEFSQFDEFQLVKTPNTVSKNCSAISGQYCWIDLLISVGIHFMHATARSAVVKLLLQIDPLRSDAIQLIFELAPDGDSKSG